MKDRAIAILARPTSSSRSTTRRSLNSNLTPRSLCNASRLNLGNKASCINLLRSLQAPREGFPQGVELGKASVPYGYNVFRRIHSCGDALCAHRRMCYREAEFFINSS